MSNQSEYYQKNKEKVKQRVKKYKEENKDKIKEYGKEYYQKNKEKIKQRVRLYHENNKDKTKEYRERNKDRIKEYSREYSKKYRFGDKREELLAKKRKYHWDNREKILEKKKEYSKRPEVKAMRNKKSKHNYDNDIQYKLTTLIRSRLRLAIKNKSKQGSAIKNLGCSVDEFKTYLENKFQEGMTWDNWSNDGWHLDHVKPLCHFNLEDPKQLAEACHYTNLQPLWSYDNISKGNKERTRTLKKVAQEPSINILDII